MRKKLFALLIGILAVTLLLTACAGVNLTLTFEVDGEAYATVTTTGQEAVQMPKNPTKEGYIFDGWYWDKDVWEKPFTANSLLETPLSDNLTVYAKWKKEAEEHVHSYGEWTVTTAATCTAEGTEKRLCECGEAETRLTEKLPHSYGEWTVVTAATCTADGLEKRVCECGEEETRVIEKLSHTYEVKHDEANHWKECAVCHENNSEGLHIYENEICAVCGKKYGTEGLSFNKINGGYEVSGIGNAQGNYIEIPSTYQTEPVIGVGSRAFYNCSSLVSVVIPNSVTSIGYAAFYNCSSLVSVVIPNSVTSIGSYAFSSCISLVSVEIPNSVTSIGSRAFYNCSSLTKVEISDIAAWCGIEFGDYDANPLYYAKHLYLNGEEVTELVIPEGVTSIGSSAFSSCISLVSVEIPNSVTSIGSSAFSSCISLVSVVIPNSVTSIGNEAFSYCYSLTIYAEASAKPSGWDSEWNSDCPVVWDYKNNNVADDGFIYTVQNGIRYGIKDGVATVVRQPRNNITTTNIPSEIVYKDNAYKVTSIGSDAFRGCSSLVSVEIPDSVTSIGDDAFYNCSSLVSVEIPSSVTSIGSYAFSGCSSLVSVVIGNGVTSIGSWAFWGCSSLVSVEIPSSVTSIGSAAFYNCSSLVSVEIPTSVTSIGSYAFSNCRSLVSVEIPTSVTSIGDDAFRGCSSLVSVVIPNSVTSIGDWAFSSCSRLVSVEIPDSVTSIGERAFYNCSSLESITIPYVGATKNGTSNTHFGYIFGANSYSDNSNYVPKALKTVIVTGGKSIGSYAFRDCSSLVSVVIGNGVTRIGDYAFSGCSRLVSVEIPSSVTSIGSAAFSSCYSLTIYAEASAKPSGWNSSWKDSNCPVVWDYKNNEVADDGFIYTVQNGIRYGIKDGVATVVRQPRNITTITIPSEIVYKDNTYSVTSIGSRAFYNCISLVSVEIPNSVTSIGTSAFSSCISLVSVVIPSSVTSIGSWAFWGCSSLVSVVIPTSVTSIGSWAFEDCSSLKSIVYDGTKAEWRKISKESGWNHNTGNYTVTCADGTLSKSMS